MSIGLGGNFKWATSHRPAYFRVHRGPSAQRMKPGLNYIENSYRKMLTGIIHMDEPGTNSLWPGVTGVTCLLVVVTHQAS